MVMLPVKISLRHRGKVLGLDREAETMTLLGPTGEPLGAVSWDAVIDFIQGYVNEAQSHRAVRNYPRSRLAAKVRLLTADHKHPGIRVGQEPRLAMVHGLATDGALREPLRLQGIAHIHGGHPQAHLRKAVQVTLPSFDVTMSRSITYGAGRRQKSHWPR